MKCYEYIPHSHPERLDVKLPHTTGDEFIWAFSSCDISFMKLRLVDKVLGIIRKNPDRTFLFQTKDPKCYHNFIPFPSNLSLGITLETNDDILYKNKRISNAPSPSERVDDFARIYHPHKWITIEPILRFNLRQMLSYCRRINPERIYMGYDTKNTKLPEPTYYEFKKLERGLEKGLPNCTIKTKFTKKGFWKDQTRLEKYLHAKKGGDTPK
jgi:hypothetical protein